MKFYFKLQELISDRIIEKLYTLGIIIIWITCIIFYLTNYYITGRIATLIYAIAALIIGIIIWRLSCELYLVIFKINNSLLEILKELRRIEK